MSQPNEVDAFLQELTEFSGLMGANRLEIHAQNIVEASQRDKDAYERGRTDDALNKIQVLALCHIASSLAVIYDNGLDIFWPGKR